MRQSLLWPVFAPRLRQGALIATVALLAACTTSPVAEESKAAVRQANIGVVSLLGDTFNGIHIGVTVFGNEETTAPVPSWNIDAYAAGLLQSGLAARGYRAGLLNRGPASADSWYVPAKGFPSEGRALDMDRLMQVAAQQKFTMVALIAHARGNSDDAHEAWMKPGFGYYERNVLGINLGCMYGLFYVGIYDVATQQKIAVTKKPSCERWDKGLPDWKAAFSQYTPAEQQTLKLKLQERLQRRIESAVGDVDL